MNAEPLLERAKAVLDRNWMGYATRPGPRLYPHQWSWDSAFVAIGYASYAHERATQELRSLLGAQWRNGLVPHIVFHPRSEGYFPGPEIWGIEASPDAPRGIKTSGIVQPPIHATAALHVARLAPEGPAGTDFLREVFPRLRAWHDYLYRERDPEGSGLAAIRHPWESGMDDSPAWDDPLARIRIHPEEAPSYTRMDLAMVAADERPTDDAYDRYVHLVECFKRHGYDEMQIREGCPFTVEDVLFNSLLAQAGKDLAEIAVAIGEDPGPFHEQAERTATAIDARLWDDRAGRYLCSACYDGQLIPAGVIAGFAPLFAGFPSPKRAALLVEELTGPSFWPPGPEGHPFASADRLSPGYSRRQYWRGPAWINVNWLLIHGLRRHGYEEVAERVKQATLELAARSGFNEYYDPETGRPLGSEDFSWSAALTIDLLNEPD